MNDIIKKRFRKIIRKHYEDHYTRTFERTKDMYVTMALVDSILDEVTVEDLIPLHKMQQTKIINELVGNLYNETWTEKILPIVSPKTGKTIEVVITFK